MNDSFGNSKNLKLGVLLSYFSMGVSILISILYTPFVIRQLGQQQYGLYNIAAAVTGYLSILNFGLGSTVIRYSAKYRAENKNDRLPSLYGLFLSIYLVLAVIIIIAGLIIISVREELFTLSTGAEGYRQLGIIIMLMVINLAISFPASVYSSIITSYEKFVYLKSVSIIQSLLTPIVVIPVLLFGYKAVGLTIAMQGLHILTSISYAVFVHFKLKIKISFKLKNVGKDIFKSIFEYTSFIFIGLIVDQLYWSTDKFILGMFVGEVSVAVYSVGASIHSYYQQFSGSISEVFFPRITAMVSKNNTSEELSSLLIKVGRLQNLLLSLILGGFIVFGKEFIYFWAGNGYENAYYIALLVITPATIPLIQSTGFLIIKAMNKHRFRAILYLFISIINALISIPAAKLWGGIGCALCTCFCALLGHGLIMNWYYYKKIKLNIPLFWKENSRILLMSIIICSVALLMNRYIITENIFVLMFKIIVYAIIYVITQYFCCANQYEKGLFNRFLHKISKTKA